MARYRDLLATCWVLAGARPDDRCGLVHVPGGEATYRDAVAAHTTTDRDPAELHQLGRDLVAELAEEYRTLGARVLGTADMDEVVARLRDDLALRFGAAADRSAATPWSGPPPPSRRSSAGCRRRLPGRRDEQVRGQGRRARLLPAPRRRRQPPGRALARYLGPRRPDPLRVRGPGLPRERPRPPPPVRPGPGAGGAAPVPALRLRDRLQRGLGPVHRAAGRRARPLLGRPGALRHAVVRFLAGLPAAVDTGLHQLGWSRPGDPVPAGQPRPHPDQHRERGRPLRRHARPGPGLHGRPPRAGPAPAAGRPAPGAASTCAPSTTWCSAPAGCRCRSWPKWSTDT